MTNQQANNPLHGLTLQHIIETLVEDMGWQKMGQMVNINCFTSDPSVKSSLKFLRKTPWARSKVEQLYLDTRKDTAKPPKKRPQSKPEAKFVWPDISKKD